MVIYNVEWRFDPTTSRPNTKGRIPNKYTFLNFSVLARNLHDAMSCLYYVHLHEIPYEFGLSVEDGKVSITRSKVDSRNFNVNYLLMDGMRQPLYMNDLKSNFNRLNSIF